MLITLSRRAVIFQSAAEVYLTGMASLGAVSHRLMNELINKFIYLFIILYYVTVICNT